MIEISIFGQTSDDSDGLLTVNTADFQTRISLEKQKYFTNKPVTIPPSAGSANLSDNEKASILSTDNIYRYLSPALIKGNAGVVNTLPLAPSTPSGPAPQSSPTGYVAFEKGEQLLGQQRQRQGASKQKIQTYDLESIESNQEPRLYNNVPRQPPSPWNSELLDPLFNEALQTPAGSSNGTSSPYIKKSPSEELFYAGVVIVEEPVLNLGVQSDSCYVDAEDILKEGTKFATENMLSITGVTVTPGFAPGEPQYEESQAVFNSVGPTFASDNNDSRVSPASAGETSFQLHSLSLSNFSLMQNTNNGTAFNINRNLSMASPTAIPASPQNQTSLSYNSPSSEMVQTQDAFGNMPVQIKSLFLEGSAGVKQNWTSTSVDPLVDPNTAGMMQFNYFENHEIQVLAKYNHATKSPSFTPLTKTLFEKLKQTGGAFVCRLKKYANSNAIPQAKRDLIFRIVDRYFILNGGPRANANQITPKKLKNTTPFGEDIMKYLLDKNFLQVSLASPTVEIVPPPELEGEATEVEVANGGSVQMGAVMDSDQLFTAESLNVNPLFRQDLGPLTSFGSTENFSNQGVYNQNSAMISPMFRQDSGYLYSVDFAAQEDSESVSKIVNNWRKSF